MLPQRVSDLDKNRPPFYFIFIKDWYSRRPVKPKAEIPILTLNVLGMQAGIVPQIFPNVTTTQPIQRS